MIELTVAAPTAWDVIPPEAWASAAEEMPALVRTHGYVPFGLPALRDAVAARFTRSGVRTAPEEIFITNGGQQAISLAASVFLKPGDWALVENPSWAGAMDALRAAGASLVPIPIDRDGARVDVIADLLKRFAPRLAYLCPTFQNPTGTVMPESRRRELARIAEESDLPILDDNALADVSLGPEVSAPAVPPPIAAFGSPGSSAGPIVTIGSMSKLFWGGLRVGWIRGPEALVERLARLKVVADHSTSIISQVVALGLLERADEVRAVRRVRGTEALDLVHRLVAEMLPDWTPNRPEGGWIVWVRLPRGDAVEFGQVALRHGVAVVAGSLASADGGFRDHLRIPIVAEPDELAEGMRRLARAWAAYTALLDTREPVRVVV